MPGCIHTLGFLSKWVSSFVHRVWPEFFADDSIPSHCSVSYANTLSLSLSAGFLFLSVLTSYALAELTVLVSVTVFSAPCTNMVYTSWAKDFIFYPPLAFFSLPGLADVGRERWLTHKRQRNMIYEKQRFFV